MQYNFSGIKVQLLQIANNDVSESWIGLCKLLNGLDKVHLPIDYLEFIKQFGEGVIGGYTIKGNLNMVCPLFVNFEYLLRLCYHNH